MLVSYKVVQISKNKRPLSLFDITETRQEVIRPICLTWLINLEAKENNVRPTFFYSLGKVKKEF